MNPFKFLIETIILNCQNIVYFIHRPLFVMSRVFWELMRSLFLSHFIMSLILL